MNTDRFATPVALLLLVACGGGAVWSASAVQRQRRELELVESIGDTEGMPPTSRS